jgi:PqqD family protein of HPr-rel-A system
VPGFWRIAPGQQLAARGWNDEFVLYNNLSGDTHLLDGDSMALLANLQTGPASLAALVATFAGDIDPDDAAALPDTIATMLDQLAGLYLVEPFVEHFVEPLVEPLIAPLDPPC